jgi:glycosyltransferase involved in cell wall biosynthesis
MKKKDEILKVLYIPSLNIPVCYWRIENYAESMVTMADKVKVNVEYFQDIIEINMAWDDACVGKGEISRDIQKKLKNAFKFFDVIIFQRIQNMPALALIQEMRKEFPDVKIVAELDDSVGEVAPSSPYKWTDHHRWSAEHLHRSDAVICSTQYLADSIKPIIGDKPVHIAPNCINKETWLFKKPKGSTEDIRIGYVGGGAHDEDLHIVYRAILPLLDENNKVQFVIRYGGFKPNWLKDHPQIDYESVGWQMHEYPQQLANMNLDLALAPLRDSEFNRCKSNLKWIEWSSMNIPLMASNVQPYKNTEGSMILVDNNIDFWRDALDDFIDGVPLEFDVKRLKYENKSKYNLHKETNKVLKFLKSLL